MSSHVITLPDGRQLGYFIVGEGVPVVYFHGTASSRLEAHLLKDLAGLNIKLVAVDRPGYGLSTYKSRKNLCDFNADLNFLMDYLGIASFSVLGWSGGGVFALAYMSCFSQRVNHGVIISAPDLPFNASTAHNVPFAKYVMRFPFLGVLAMKNMRRQILSADTSEAFLRSSQGRQMLHSCSKSDLTFFSDSSWVNLMLQSLKEAFRQESSVQAVMEEHMLFLNSWNCFFGGLGGKLHVWHGEEDKTCPVNNAYGIVHKFKGASLEVFPRQGHFVMFNNLSQLSERLV